MVALFWPMVLSLFALATSLGRRLRLIPLLNIRGLSEIVFLNLLLQHQLISPALYFALMLMSLTATLLPALRAWAGCRLPSIQSNR